MKINQSDIVPVTHFDVSILNGTSVLFSSLLEKNGRHASKRLIKNNLEWVTWLGYIPDTAVSIYNGYAERRDYVCKHGCDCGFYNPEMGPYCYYPYLWREYKSSSFEILVNKDDFELIEWKKNSFGYVPQYSVRTCPSQNEYVGKNIYGLGKVNGDFGVFFLPWGGFAFWYLDYQVLTFSREILSDDISHVKYEIERNHTIKYPPETLSKTVVSNNECNPMTEKVSLSDTIEEEQRWNTSFFIPSDIPVTITTKVPLISASGITMSPVRSFRLSKGTTHIQSNTLSITTEQEVPATHSCQVSMLGHKYQADIPFTARLRRTYRNGETRWTSISGTFNTVRVGEVEVDVGACKPIPDPKPC